MNIAVCDDNRDDAFSVIQSIEKYVAENKKNWKITYYSSGNEFVKNAKETDVVLMDIEMPEVNGIKAGREARVINPELKIIMFTGAEGYGEDIFDIGAVNYLRKPADPKRLIEALKVTESHLIGDAYINVNKDWMPYLLKQKDVEYIKAFNGASLLYSNNNEFRSDKTLAEVEKSLDERIFLRIDKSLIVNLMKVKSLNDGYFITERQRLKISRRRLNSVKKAWIEFDLNFNVGERGVL